jgi:hypothetical protein
MVGVGVGQMRRAEQRHEGGVAGRLPDRVRRGTEKKPRRKNLARLIHGPSTRPRSAPIFPEDRNHSRLHPAGSWELGPGVWYRPRSKGDPANWLSPGE